MAPGNIMGKHRGNIEHRGNTGETQGIHGGNTEKAQGNTEETQRKHRKKAVLLPAFKGILTENRNAHYGQIDTQPFCHHA
ncbi:hypothetical protein ANTQUA_LOCUS6989 [Anthophora quadrimaculata]